MAKIILTTMDNDVVLDGEEDLIELARIELKEDVFEANDGWDDMPDDYPREINTFNEALVYLQTYFDDRYHNIYEIDKKVA